MRVIACACAVSSRFHVSRAACTVAPRTAQRFPHMAASETSPFCIYGNNVRGIIVGMDLAVACAGGSDIVPWAFNCNLLQALLGSVVMSATRVRVCSRVCVCVLCDLRARSCRLCRSRASLSRRAIATGLQPGATARRPASHLPRYNVCVCVWWCRCWWRPCRMMMMCSIKRWDGWQRMRTRGEQSHGTTALLASRVHKYMVVDDHRHDS